MDVSHFGLFYLNCRPPRRTDHEPGSTGRIANDNAIAAGPGGRKPVRSSSRHADRLLFRLVLRRGQEAEPA